MVNLTHLVFFLKKSRKPIILGVTSFVILLLVMAYWKQIVRAIFPPPPPSETVAFGILAPYDITDGVKQKGKIVFRLQTITGNLPDLPKKAKVFAVAGKIPSFAAEQNIKQKARSLRFIPEPTRLTGSVMEFTGQDDSRKNLIFDTLTGNFTLSYKLEPALIEEKPTSEDEAKNIASSFFSLMELNFETLPVEKITTKKLRFEGNNIFEADSLINSDMIEVDYNFGEIDMMPAVFIKKGIAPVFSIVANKKVVYAKNSSPNFEIFKFAGYPLKTVSQAWDELNGGKGYFNSDAPSGTVDIVDIKLGYVIGTRDNKYIQPVYLFIGREGFVAFVPAVSEKWVGTANP